MARILSNRPEQEVSLSVITHFKDGSESSRTFKVGDVVEGLRYVSNSKVVTVTGKISAIKYNTFTVSRVDAENVKDFFNDDIRAEFLVIDCSAQYESNIVTVPVMEIVEDDGVVDVVKVTSSLHPRVTMDMEYTDGSVVNQDLEVGDVITDFVAMSGTPGTPDITGDFRITAFAYKNVTDTPVVTGLYLTPLDGGKAINVPFGNMISFVEQVSAYVTADNSLGEIADALTASESGVVYAQLNNDVTIPLREDGRITTLMVGEGQELNLDLNGHELNCVAYALYGDGGVINVENGTIKCGIVDKTYGAIQAAGTTELNMKNITLDTTNVEVGDNEHNWLYGVVGSGSATINIEDCKITTDEASCIGITNQTSDNATFIIGGDSVLKTTNCGCLYIADEREVIIKDNAVIDGSIVARMGEFTIQDNAKVMSPADRELVDGIGVQVTFSGVTKATAAFWALTGIYGTNTENNDMIVNVKDNAKIIGKLDKAIEVMKIDTKFDQKVVFDIASKANLVSVDEDPIRVYDNAELREIASAAGKTLGAATKITDLTIKIAKQQVYPAAE